MKPVSLCYLTPCLLIFTLIWIPSQARAQRFSLGTAQNFTVLGGSTVTNTGPSVLTGDLNVPGDLGVSPGSAFTGFPPGIVTPPGTIHAADAVALQAKNDVTASYNALAALAPTQNLTGQDLGGLTLSPGDVPEPGAVTFGALMGVSVSGLIIRKRKASNPTHHAE